MRPVTEEDLNRAMPLRSVLVRAYAKTYQEIRTKEVEDGYVQPWELKERYPYRVPRNPPISYIEIKNQKGEIIRLDVEWQLVMMSDEHFVIAWDGDAVVKVGLAEECVIEANDNTFTWSSSAENSARLETSEPPQAAT